MLGFLLLALHNDSGGKVGEANRAAGFVDMLSSGPAGPVNIYPDIFVVYFNGNFAVKLRVDKDRRKGYVYIIAIYFFLLVNSF